MPLSWKTDPAPRILDVCCGTGSVILAFDGRYPGSMSVGCDFSGGMLRKAMEKNAAGSVFFVEGDAASPSFRGRQLRCGDLFPCPL